MVTEQFTGNTKPKGAENKMNDNNVTQITIPELMDIVIQNLQGISVPVEMTQQIGMPLFQNLGYLKQIRDVMRKEDEKRAEEEAAKEASAEENGAEIVQFPVADE